MHPDAPGTGHSARSLQPSRRRLPDGQDQRHPVPTTDFRNILPRFTPEAREPTRRWSTCSPGSRRKKAPRRRRSRSPGCSRRSRGSSPIPGTTKPHGWKRTSGRRHQADRAGPRRNRRLQRHNPCRGRAHPVHHRREDGEIHSWKSNESAHNRPTKGRRTSSPARCASIRSSRRPTPPVSPARCVTFEPGARTAWHTHPLGQTLIVTAGCGRVQRGGGPIEEIHPGRHGLVSAGRKALARRRAGHGHDPHCHQE